VHRRDRISIDYTYTPSAPASRDCFFTPLISFSTSHQFMTSMFARVILDLARCQVGTAYSPPLARCPDQDLPNGMSGTLMRSGCRSVGRLLVWVACPTPAGVKSNGQRWEGTVIRSRLFGAVASRVPRRRSSANRTIHSTRSPLTRCVCRFILFFLVLHFSLHNTLHFIASGIACGEVKGTKRFLAGMWWKRRTALPPRP
jgi:hypothetical protein